MNLLFYMSRYPGYGGIETVTSMILPKLLENDSISVSILAHISEDNPQCFTQGVKIYVMPDNVDKYTGNNYLYAKKIIENGNIDAIVYQDSYGYTEQIVCELSKIYCIPLYVFEHNSPLFIYNKRGLEPITSPKGFLRRLLHPLILHREISRKKYLLKHCTKYVLLSKQFIPEFCQLIGEKDSCEKVTYINNPCNPVDTIHHLTKIKTVLCVCQLNKTKQVDKMLKLWATINEHLGDWTFQIVGDGPEMEHLKSIVSDYNIPRVEFIGYTNPAPYYERASIFWMMSKFEGWGMTLIESMQYGCVPIAWNSYSSLTDIIDDGINGYIVVNKDLKAFGASTIFLANNIDKLKEMSLAAKEKSKKFYVDRIVKDWESLLNL